MKPILLAAAFVAALAACSTTPKSRNRPGDPANVRRTSDFCVEFDHEARGFVCNTGPMTYVSINGAMAYSPNPAPSPVPTAAKKASK